MPMKSEAFSRRSIRLKFEPSRKALNLMSIPSTLKTRVAVTALALLGASFVGCIYEVGIPADGSKPFGEMNPIEGMHNQTSYKDQEAQPVFRDDQIAGMRTPPPATVAVNGLLRPDQPSPDASAQLVNPVPVNAQSLDYGRFLYRTNCSVCHGSEGAADGTIVVSGAYGAPPSLLTDKLRGYEDGRIYHVVSYGQGAMWAYKNNLTDMERWAVVNYVRALQRADFPEPIDLDRMRDQ
ncbi:hypothetical protein DV096_08550 [Bradymonadaceae bacterium TMQ3]|uniref:C-type cytochrome n=2 Tax=Lujinxingia sediminis TaxID=2480984 RepID=A0ABY0CTW4_9DELT|nr:hypothetical protein DV096_08550 [Bradymonadaceae bacterium TMQ3]RVU44071.1 c-type cytochrome [Lujinxingia sediminis]TXC76391.1 c-type cytochrome [Bradymonadales bacterium TMQ1]